MATSSLMIERPSLAKWSKEKYRHIVRRSYIEIKMKGKEKMSDRKGEFLRFSKESSKRVAAQSIQFSVA
jgi:hypothetical protein